MPHQMRQPIKVGLIGYSLSTKVFHLPYITLLPADLEVYAFLQRAPAPSKPAQGAGGGWGHCTIDYPKAKHYRTAEEFFADEEIELVIVCTRPDSHAEFATKALCAGKHVVVEKPFVRTSAEADALIDLAKAKGKILTVFQSRRLDGDFQTLQSLLAKKALGDVTEAEIHYDVDSPAWAMTKETRYEPGNGMAFGIGVHTIDQALVLFGQPKSVTGFFRALRGVEGDLDDSFTIILQYADNRLVTIKTTIISPLQDQLKYFVRGTEGSFLKFGFDPQEDQVAQERLSPQDPRFGVEADRLHGTLTTKSKVHKCQEYDEASKNFVGRYPTVKGRLLGYYENLVQAIRGKASIQVRPEEARDVIRVIELARQSHAEGKTIFWPFK